MFIEGFPSDPSQFSDFRLSIETALASGDANELTRNAVSGTHSPEQGRQQRDFVSFRNSYVFLQLFLARCRKLGSESAPHDYRIANMQTRPLSGRILCGIVNDVGA